MDNYLMNTFQTKLQDEESTKTTKKFPKKQKTKEMKDLSKSPDEPFKLVVTSSKVTQT